MAGFKVEGIDELQMQLTGIDSDEIAKAMIDGSIEYLEKAFKEGAQSAANRGYATGQLVDSISATPAKEAKGGIIGAVTAKGKNLKGVSNRYELLLLEYGTSRQAAHPFIKAMTKACEPAVLDKMQKIFEEKMKKQGGLSWE